MTTLSSISAFPRVICSNTNFISDYKSRPSCMPFYAEGTVGLMNCDELGNGSSLKRHFLHNRPNFCPRIIKPENIAPHYFPASHATSECARKRANRTSSSYLSARRFLTNAFQPPSIRLTFFQLSGDRSPFIRKFLLWKHMQR